MKKTIVALSLFLFSVVAFAAKKHTRKSKTKPVASVTVILSNKQKIVLTLVFNLPCGKIIINTWNVAGGTPSEISTNVGALGLTLQNKYCGTSSGGGGTPSRT